MSEGSKAEKPEVKQEETSSSSIWSEIARDVALTAVMGSVGFGLSKGFTAGLEAARAQAAEHRGEEVAKLALETALPLVTMGLGAAAARGAMNGAESALKAGVKGEESTTDKAYDIYKRAHEETLPFIVLGPLALMPQLREPIKEADGLALDRIKSVSEKMVENVRKEPWRFAAMSVGSPLIPVLDAIINNEK